MMKRAVVWAGVSSKPQAQDDRDSLATQLAEGLDLCQRNGWQVVARLVVPGITRSHIDLQDAIAAVDEAIGSDRSGLFARQLAELGADGENAYRRLAELIAARQVDVVVCRSRDRLGRTDSLIAGIEERLRRAGGVVYSLAMPPTGSAGGDLYVSAVERASGQHYVLQLVQATRRGMDHRAAQGLVLTGPVAFGYRSEWRSLAGRLVRWAAVDGREADAYRWAASETLAGSMRQVDVIDRLRSWFPERQWSSSALTGILRSPFYLGLVLRRRARTEHDRALLRVAGEGGILGDAHWPEIEALLLRRVETDGKARGNSPAGQRVYVASPGQHEALIDTGTWLEVQRLLDGRAVSRRPASPRGLWAGILRCGVCGQRLYVDARRDRAGREYVNYRCGSRLTAARCGNPGLSERKATRLIAGYLRAILTQRTPDDAPVVLAPGPDRAALLERELADLAERRGRLILLFETGRIDLEEFDARQSEAAVHGARLEGELRSLRDAVGKVERQANRRALLAEVLPDLEERLLSVPAAEANALLRQIFTEIRVARGEVTGVELG